MSSTLLDRPTKPLKILTLDGCGLQAISALLILDKLLSSIQSENNAPVKPRPCDVFDTIGGIGAGGWLALLLGRFHLDITSCLTEWYNLIHCIKPRTSGEGFRRRLFQHTYFDTEHLMEQVDYLTKLYGTGEHLFRKDPVRVRCRYVFVAALDAEKKGSALDYNLFRTYACPPNNTKLRKGPTDPSTYLMTRAFAVTGAAKYFSTPWKEQLNNNGKTKFLDTKFPNPHNITELALDEMWGLFGTDVPLSIVVNIGPGLPNSSDFKTISRRFSWGRNSPPPSPRVSVKSFGRRSSNGQHSSQRPDADDKNLVETTGNRGIHFDTNKASLDEALSKNRLSDIPVGHKKIPKTTTFGSIAGRPLDEKLRRLESDIEQDIQKKLKAKYPENTPPYYRLAPNNSPEGTAQNDASEPGIVLDATNEFLAGPRLQSTMDSARQLLVI